VNALQSAGRSIKTVGMVVAGAGCLLIFCAIAACRQGEPVDEAAAAGLTTTDFPQITADIFKPMDGGIELSSEEIMGRNAWILWSAGNQRFWDFAARDSYGLIDLLKMLDNRKYPREQRFRILGLMNEPGFRAPGKPDKFGLWLDDQVTPEPAGIDEKVYGKPSGVIGFRLFPNPEFDEQARQQWDGGRFMHDPAYYNNRKLVRPYRVGVACGVCHVAPNPVNPPENPESPGWENLASAIGNQYINEGKVFACNVEKGGFFYEMLAAQPRGTSDTSRIATDHINNPNAINPIFLLGERERIAAREKMAGGTLDLPGEENEMNVPHILKDGGDSIGIAGAALRVYVNIGMFSEYWLTLHDKLIGLTPQKPFEIAYARKHSVYWRATAERVGKIAAFFRRLKPLHLKDAPGGASFITSDETVMARGKTVFAENCAGCHSSKQTPSDVDPRSPEGKAWFRTAVNDPGFLDDNFLSNDRPYPVTTIKTNSARAFATNAVAGHVWDNFSSQTYKERAPIEGLEFLNPFDQTHRTFKPRVTTGGPGYYRTASLINVWSSAPLLHNNSLGEFTGDPSVTGRMKAFIDAIEKLLWPEKRLGQGSIWRTQNECALQLRKEFVPAILQKIAGGDGCIKIGFIPKGTPVNLIGNLEPSVGQLAVLQAKITAALTKIHAKNLSSGGATAELIKLVPELLAANKCPDFVEDEGHYFGTDLSDSDKRALIEFLKTF
jgi:mono/diheme cytochrome c family protein